MSAIQDIEFEDEDAEPEYAYMFLVGYNEDGRYLDAFLDVSDLIGLTEAGIKAKAKLLGPDHESLKHTMGVMQSVNSMALRFRFNGGHLHGIYLLKAAIKLDFRLLNSLVRSFSKERLEELKLRSVLP